ncbi:hypothetical protein LLE49_04225 [Alicyclobacillus tolerans]|uniref:hypothetical protein n=1 Tax=Alicyclobacillus tolerans TaxID=90970 RepID=UPI001F24B679|nr:hypothetical protein [Alicyclobacillus tolerans]MCF8563942.1 hypothetical protein [Alicyclobacillus tolerans]
MRVKISECSKHSYWYASRLNEVFSVVQICGGMRKYEVEVGSNKTAYVDFGDAVVVPDSPRVENQPSRSTMGSLS